MSNCQTCRFWSDKLAQAMWGGPLEAYCLAHEGANRGKYTPSYASCESWKDAPLGAIDSGSHEDPIYGNPYEGEQSNAQ